MKVTVKDVPVTYNGEQFKPGETVEVEEKHFNENLFEKAEQDATEEEADFFALTADQLKKINNDKLKAFLDKEEIGYGADDKKEDFIKLILGE